MQIICTITGIIYTNANNGYSVLSAKNKENNEIFTLVIKYGMIDPKIGFNLIVEGEWMKNSKYGEQFTASSYQELVPTTEEGIIAYLSCGIFKGIGEKNAQKIVNVFGADTINIIDNNPERLYEVKGLGDKKVQALIAGWSDHKYIKDIVCFFSPFGLTTNMIMKIYKKYGNDAIDIVSENPYCIAKDIDGIGFRRADDIAMKLGVDKDSPNRISSCVNYVLTEANDEGHTFLYLGTLISKANDYLEINSELIGDIIQEMLEEEELKTVGGKEIFSKYMFEAEKSVASKLVALYNFKPYVSSMFPISIEEIEKAIGIEYNDKQKQAITTSINSNIMVLTGGPGTGKTTALLGIIQALISQNLSIAAAAPTGRAAKRMTEVTKIPATTIHRLLEYNPQMGYMKNEQNPLYQDVVIIDEVSMVNIPLMYNLLKAVKPSTKLILVGDENQLPSIGAGNILHDIIASEKIPVITLKEIFRQAEGSRIITNSHNIINNIPIVINNQEENTDFFFIKQENPDDVERVIDNLVTNRLPKKYGVPPTEIQVLSPRRKDVKCCANNLNKVLQASINKSYKSITYGDNIFKEGDKVMQIKNNYDKEVFNGDVGFIQEIDEENKIIVVRYDDNFVVSYENTEFDEIILAYASTIHKSQGSEYPIVIIPIMNSFSIMLKRNLIYTGITRAKNICIIIGERKALARAINDDSYDKRNTMLQDWLENMID